MSAPRKPRDLGNGLVCASFGRDGEWLSLATVDPEGIPAVLDGVKQSGLPNLFIPRAEAFVQVEALPMLGTGKIDLQALKRIANEAMGS